MAKRVQPVVLSLCDYSGSWSAPFLDHRILPVRVDPKHGGFEYSGRGLRKGVFGNGEVVPMPDGGIGLALSVGSLLKHLRKNPKFLNQVLEKNLRILGIMIAPPCTDFSSSGARWFKGKDADGRTRESISIVRECLAVKDILDPKWWVLENPQGRIATTCAPELGVPLLRFDPCDYAGFADDPDREAYTKRTALYGDFNTELVTDSREPVYYYRGGKRGSWMWANLGGKSERTKALRSKTPQGFSRAFAQAQAG